MDVQNQLKNVICRMCLCKSENPKNMLLDAVFATKVMQVFPKIQISTDNGLSNLVCDYCHNLIEQFYGYFETVNANQEELKAMNVNVQKEEIFAVPIERIEENPEMQVKAEDTEWFDNNDEPMNSLANEHCKRAYKQKEVIPVEFSKDVLLKLNYYELTQLPLNFTCSYLCPLCPELKMFKTKSWVKKHIIKVHLTRLPESQRLRKAENHLRNLESQCDICNKKRLYKDHLGYRDHKFVHYGIKPYKCDICNHTADTKEKLRRHLWKHVKRVRRLGCLYCNTDFSSAFLRNEHIREKHQDRMITCDLCGLKLIEKKLAKYHFREHKTKSLMLECERCIGGVRFPNKRVLELHKKLHEREDKFKKPFSCHLCERKFHKENAFKVHLGYHADGKISPCPICGKSETIFTKRKISKHAHDHLSKKLKCDKCDAEFPSRGSFVHHYRSVHDRKEQSCYRCGKMIAAYMMKRHLQQCNAGDLPCRHCPVVFKKESHRRRHNRDFHFGIRCIRCNVFFEKPSQLLIHQKYDPDHVKTKKTLNRRKKQNNSERTLS